MTGPSNNRGCTPLVVIAIFIIIVTLVYVCTAVDFRTSH